MSLWRKWKERSRPLSDAREIRKFHGNPNGWARTNHPFGNGLYFIPPIYRWLVVSNIFFPHIGNNNPTDVHIFQRGWNHQPDGDLGGWWLWLFYRHYCISWHQVKVQTCSDRFGYALDLWGFIYVALPEHGKQRCSLGPPFAASTLSFSGSRSSYLFQDVDHVQCSSKFSQVHKCPHGFQYVCFRDMNPSCSPKPITLW